VGDGEEEQPIADGKKSAEMEITDSEDGDVSHQKKSKEPSSDDVFCSLDKANIRDAVSFTMKWSQNDAESIT
jgi:hypothetical protein